MDILIVVAGFMVPLLILGMFGNLNLIYSTWKFKDLRNRNNLLLAIIAAFDTISEIHEWKKAIEIFLGKAVMKRRHCFNSIFLYCYSFNMASIAILFLAIDRFLAVQSPIKYRTVRTTHFIGLALCIGFIYSTVLVITGFIVADDELINPCDQTMAYSSDLMTVWNYCSVGIDSAVFILNIIDYYLLRNIGKRHQLSESDYAAYRRQNQLTNSMLITMVANCLTSLLSTFTLFIINFLPISTDTIGDISSFLCLAILFNYGNNYYILFWRSRVYRAKFLGQLHLIRRSATVGFTDKIVTITKKCKWFH